MNETWDWRIACETCGGNGTILVALLDLSGKFKRLSENEEPCPECNEDGWDE